MAEQSGLIVPLTFHIMRASLEACGRWRSRYPECRVAVNISPLVLADPRLPDEIDRILHETRLGPGALIAEITESTVIANPMLAAEVLTRLRIKGVELSIDDFGTGHSSLLALLRLPFSELKIDRSFVSQCEFDPEAWKIVRATVSMARSWDCAWSPRASRPTRSCNCCAGSMRRGSGLAVWARDAGGGADPLARHQFDDASVMKQGRASVAIAGWAARDHAARGPGESRSEVRHDR